MKSNDIQMQSMLGDQETTHKATYPLGGKLRHAMILEAMSKEELKAAGLNDSNTHVDFMVGTADLSIIGTTKDGREIPVFVNGNFAL